MEPEERHWIIYDDQCRFCRRQIKAIKFLDWFGKFESIPAQVYLQSTPGDSPPLSEQQLMESVHVLTPNNRILREARAVRFVLIRTPLLFLFGLLLWLPGIFHL